MNRIKDLETEFCCLDVQGSIYIDSKGGASSLFMLKNSMNLPNKSDDDILEIIKTVSTCMNHIFEKDTDEFQVCLSLGMIHRKKRQVLQYPKTESLVIESLKKEKESQFSELMIEKKYIVVVSIEPKESVEYKQIPKDIIKKSIALLQENVLMASTMLRQLNLGFTLLEDDELLNTLVGVVFDDYNNCKQSEFQSASEHMSRYPIHNQLNHLELNTHIARCFSLKTITNYETLFPITHSFGNINANIDVWFFFKKASTEAMKKGLAESKNINLLLSGLAGTFSSTSRKKFEKKSDYFEDILNTVDAQTYVDIHSHIVIRSESLETLENNQRVVLNMLKQHTNFVYGEATARQLEILLSSLPNQLVNKNKVIVKLDEAPYFMPLGYQIESQKNGNIPFTVYRDPKLNGTFQHNLIKNELPAPHIAVVGGSGGGKSFFCNVLLMNVLLAESKTNITIIDMGGSYKKLCKVFGGSYIDVNLNADSIDIFPSKNFLEDPDVFSEQKLIILNYLKLLISTKKESNFSNSDDALIFESLEKMYATYSEPLLKDFVTILKQNTTKRAQEFCKQLSVYLQKSSPYFTWFSSRSTHKLNEKRVTVFDITQLKNSHLGPLYLEVITNMIKMRMFGYEESGISQVVVKDECWSLFDNDIAREMLSETYRTARRYRTVLVSITQVVSDFTNPKCDAILKNTYSRFVLKNNETIDDLLAFGLTEKEAERAKQLTVVKGHYSTALLKIGDEAEIIQTKPTPMEYAIACRDGESRDLGIEVDNAKNEEELVQALTKDRSVIACTK